ncbi:hypothetical protein FA95DRAFT_443042 [Auriscalpium vulgare]|uniref:Uncharacterized protein n=1 Tax=Auriscalpium vulgare TaxID=40419 RepID=A0ACB8RGG5_9AGAM|nr:hypothetical protein FA95DRAFT_443042 [Auriscalpium vulgare]
MHEVCTCLRAGRRLTFLPCLQCEHLRAVRQPITLLRSQILGDCPMVYRCRRKQRAFFGHHATRQRLIGRFLGCGSFWRCDTTSLIGPVWRPRRRIRWKVAAGRRVGLGARAADSVQAAPPVKLKTQPVELLS